MTTKEAKNDIQKAAEREMASRVLSKRRLLPFTQRMNPKYMAGWVHEDICRRLERFSDDVAKGLSPRLMLLMPPRHGKSELASKMFPAWHLGRNPDHEIIACSYNISLAMGFSKKIKALFDDPTYQTVFDARLNPDNRSTEEWAIQGNTGGYVAAGVGGGITGKGAHCLPAGTMISTERGPIDIANLYLLKSKPRVLSYDRRGRVVAKPVLAFSTRVTDDLFEITTKLGAKLVLTGDHPVYLPDTDEFVRADQLEALYGTPENDDRFDLRELRDPIPARSMQPQQVPQTEMPRVLLLEGMQPGAPRREEREAVRAMPEADHAGHRPLQEREILLQRMLAGGASAPRGGVPAVWGGACHDQLAPEVLLEGLRERGPQYENAGAGELALQARAELFEVVRRDAAADHGEGRGMCSVQVDCETAHPSRQPPARGQLSNESGLDVQQPSYDPPQVKHDTLAMVRRVRGSPVTVYDLEVAETHNFFANGVCVHNCLIIDDPIKNAEEADSPTTREGLWDWYGSTAYTRLAPGAGVLCIQTWWHDDDLAGRLQQAMADDPEADQFEIIKYPAIADFAEFLDTSTDEIVRVTTDAKDSVSALIEAAKLGIPTEELKFLRAKGDPLHEARYDIKKLNRIKKTIGQRFWSALYQQNPVPDDGAFFTKDMFRRGKIPEKGEANVNIAWDFAIGIKKENDFTVGTVGLQDYDDQLHIAEQIHMKSNDADIITSAMLDLGQKWYHSSLIIGVEDGQIWRTLESTFFKACRARKFYPAIKVLPPLTDKQVRASPLKGRMQAGMVSFNEAGEWYDACRSEMLRFPSGVHDDRVDSCAWVAQVALGREPPKRPAVKKEKSWKDKLKVGSRGASHMAA